MPGGGQPSISAGLYEMTPLYRFTTTCERKAKQMGRKNRRIVTTQQAVANHFSVSRRTVVEWRALGCPGRPGEYDLDKVDRWRRARQPDADVLLTGPASPALEQFRRARARREELALARELNEVLPRDKTYGLLGRFAGHIRWAGQELQRRCGPEAFEILNEAIDDAEKEEEQFAEMHALRGEGAETGPAPDAGSAIDADGEVVAARNPPTGEGTGEAKGEGTGPAVGPRQGNLVPFAGVQVPPTG